MHGAIGGAYRSQRITTLELRFNPMKRNRGGERDLDHIILAAVRGLDLANLEYPQVRAGLILMMDRTFDARLNEIVVEKATAGDRGVVGVDIAGPRPGGGRYDYTQLTPMVEAAREAGLGITIHVGEEGGDIGREELARCSSACAPTGSATASSRRATPSWSDAARPRRRARDLPHLEPAHEGTAERGGGARHVPRLRRRGWRSRSRRTVPR